MADGLSITMGLRELSERLTNAAAIAKAAVACAECGAEGQALRIAMDVDELLHEAQTLHGTVCLIGRLQRRAQAEVHGDLDRSTQEALHHLFVDGTVIRLPDLPATKPGTLPVREWEGHMHSVMVLKDGFAWNGTTYPSLSAVALAITGTRWNGPRFFGLRSKR